MPRKPNLRQTIIVFGDERVRIEHVFLTENEAEARALKLLDEVNGDDTDWHVLNGWRQCVFGG
jgi:hypothetical protein